VRRRPRIDGNHRDIVEALEQIGASVQSLAAVGDGCPDLLVGRGGRVWLLEVKDGSKSASRRALTQDQREWINWFNGDVHIVTSVDEAIRVVTPTQCDLRAAKE
jgi:Holliday junction resolvase